ncbi:MAG TPA: right-handed parallel beta-helix repeat-containing protein [Candidatus Krumholzibacteria bacterium]|nr:right-handed parallel beta-helix repeat-containing protein [Candidatus Krumholzibacteria bacterium]HPD70179.1 right-handed parallel beta-helix repeat-containing protein [Candidatus Krumholzibacteria bacterium]HRY40121.1 right-handed parallel beta-helix repeat-containing protein [Candidatus Krumholzibacteria bacterium]
MRHPALAFCVSVLLASSAAAATYYVSATSGSPGGSGTIDDPFLTIQQGLDAAAPAGDEVVAMPGTYSGIGNHDLATLGKAVTVRGQLGAAYTIIDVASPLHDGFFLDDSGEDQDTRIESFTIRNGRYGIRMDLAGTAPILADLVFEANALAGIRYQVLAPSLGALDIIDCVFAGHPGDAIHLDILTVKGATTSRRDPFAVIDGCTFTGNGTGVDCDRPLEPMCRIADCDFSGNGLATWGSVELDRCAISGGGGCDGELEGLPHWIRATDCRFTGLSGPVFGDAQEIQVAGCEIDGNVGDIHAGGPSEEAYESLAFTTCDIHDNTGGILLGPGQATLALIDCLYTGNGAPVRYANAAGAGSLLVSGCTLAGNLADALEVVAALGGATVENCIVAGNGGAGLDWQAGSATWTIACNDFWQNTGGDYAGLADQTGLNLNIRANPLFCAPAAGDYGLRADSPCLPGATGCGLMGARDQACLRPALWHVATWGDDTTGTGDADRPFRTVQVAIDAAAQGDSVVVYDGTYPEALAIAKGLCLYSASGNAEQCVLAGIPGHRVLTIHAAPDTVRVLDFGISGGRPQQGDYEGLNPGGGVLVYESRLVMERCRVNDNETPLDETATAGGGVHTREHSYLRLVDCEIFDNDSFRAGGVMHRSNHALDVYGCLVHHNHSERQAGGIWILPPSVPDVTCRLAGNTIAHNTAVVNGSGFEALQSDLWLERNIVAFNSGGACQVRLTNCTGTVACNDLYDPAGGCVFDAEPALPRPTDINADPWFCRKHYGDFALLDGSPCAAGESACGQIGARGEGCSYTGVPPAGATAVATLWPPLPNPFNARTTIEFSVPEPARVRLVVFDLRGAVVATLLDAQLPRGLQTAMWSGSDMHGRPAAAGVYVVRLQAGAQVRTQRVALIK